MRIDKYLWCVRKFKTRSLASDAIKKNRVYSNDELVKASREVKVGDKLSFRKDGVLYSIEVLDIPKSRVGAKLVPELIRDITPQDELEKANFIQLMHKLSRPRGTGRPTKKERRDLDDFIDPDEEAVD